MTEDYQDVVEGLYRQINILEKALERHQEDSECYCVNKGEGNTAGNPCAWCIGNEILNGPLVPPKPKFLCAGCAVNEPFEHRCHQRRCSCNLCQDDGK